MFVIVRGSRVFSNPVTYVTVQAKTSHVCMQTELMPQLLATLYNYACPLANVNWVAFPECFLSTM